MTPAEWDARAERLNRAMVEAVAEVIEARAQEALADDEFDKREALGLCVHCGDADLSGSHYDAWSDYGGGDGPDGWICERK